MPRVDSDKQKVLAGTTTKKTIKQRNNVDKHERKSDK